jgi:hypothetical protein
MYRKTFIVFSFVLVLVMAFSAVAPVSAQPSLKFNGGGHVEESPNGVYIVQMITDPVVEYKGEIRGLRATKPQPGQKIDPNSPAVVSYVGYLDSKHNEALRRAGGQ